MPLHTRVDGDGADGQRLAVDPLFAADGGKAVPKHRMPDTPHARSGDRVQIAAYRGKSERFDGAVAEFAKGYADQTERDHAALCAAVKSGRVSTDEGV